MYNKSKADNEATTNQCEVAGTDSCVVSLASSLRSIANPPQQIERIEFEHCLWEDLEVSFCRHHYQIGDGRSAGHGNDDTRLKDY